MNDATRPQQPQQHGHEEDDEAFCRLQQELEEEPLGRCGSLLFFIIRVPAVLILLPVRFVLVVITLTFMWVVCMASRLLECSCRPSRRAADQALRAHSVSQQNILRVNGFLSRLVLFWCGFFWIPVRRERPKAGLSDSSPHAVAPTIILNHSTMLDGFITGHLVKGKATGVAFAWLLKLPFLGAIGKAYHMLVVGRKAVGARKGSVAPNDIGRLAAADVIANYQRRFVNEKGLFPLVVFPEGTTKAARCLLKFRTGAFISGEPVLPVVLKFPHRHVDISWVQSLPVNTFRVLTQWVNRAEIIVLDVYSPNEAEKSDPTLYAANVQRVMAASMNLPPERISTTVGFKEVQRWLTMQQSSK